MTARRDFLKSLGALGSCGALPRSVAAPAGEQRPRFSRDPFALGVASGYPSPHGVVLWTRLVSQPDLPDGGIVLQAIAVRWEIARDEALQQIVQHGVVNALASDAHAVHVEARGLEPDRWYWYRFHAGDAASPVGRTRTAPARDSAVQQLRFAFASCQQYEQGYYTAHRAIARDAPDLVAFLGDYIYESSWGRDHVRTHGAGEPYTLAEYRQRYARYKSDPDLQASHAACPWIVTWDDHEVDNDYADDRSQDGTPREAFLARRAAAYKAYYEHMPLPARMRPDGAALRLYTQLGWGMLARFYLLDDRQYRRWQVCARGAGGSNVVDPARCPALLAPGRSMLGARQERWLSGALERSSARWNVLAQQTLMAQVDRKPGPERAFWTDGWDGYPAARRRLLEELAARRTANPVVIGGDVHFHAVSDLRPDFDQPESPVVATEFCGTSITSQSASQRTLDRWRDDNPHLRHLDGEARGYVRVEVTPQRWRAELRGLDTVKKRDAPCRTRASFVVEDGRPGALRD